MRDRSGPSFPPSPSIDMAADAVPREDRGRRFLLSVEARIRLARETVRTYAIIAAASRSFTTTGGSRSPGAIISGSVDMAGHPLGAARRAGCRSGSAMPVSAWHVAQFARRRRTCGPQSPSWSSSAALPVAGRSRHPSVVSVTTESMPRSTSAITAGRFRGSRSGPRSSQGSSASKRRTASEG